MSLLKVKKKKLLKYGAVSIETCRQMCKNLLKISKSNIAVSITGIAGPGGGTVKKPVGLVYIGIASKKKIANDKNIKIDIIGKTQSEIFEIENDLKISVKELNEREESYPKNMVVPKVTWRLSKQIVSINGSTDKGEIVKFIEKMPIMDSKYITKFLSDNSPGLDLIREVTAPSGKKVLTRIAFGAEFFRPFF